MTVAKPRKPKITDEMRSRKQRVLTLPAQWSDAQVAEEVELPERTVTLIRQIHRMHGEDMSRAAMSGHLGISRERVRQLVAELDLESRLETIHRRNQNLIADAGKLDDEALAAKYNVSVSSVGLILRNAGISTSEGRKARLEEAIRQVKNGTSIRQAAMANEISPGTLAEHLDAAGVKSTHGRWGALAHRFDIIPEMLGKGASMADILDRLRTVEKRDLREQTLRIWIREHLDPKFGSVEDREVETE